MCRCRPTGEQGGRVWRGELQKATQVPHGVHQSPAVGARAKIRPAEVHQSGRARSHRHNRRHDQRSGRETALHADCGRYAHRRRFFFFLPRVKDKLPPPLSFSPFVSPLLSQSHLSTPLLSSPLRLLSTPFSPIPFPSSRLPLEVGPLNTAIGSGGAL